MAKNQISERQLKEVLDKLIIHLENHFKDQGVSLQFNVDTDAIANNILAGAQQITEEDLKNPKFLKALCISVMAEQLNNQSVKGVKDLELNYKNMFDPEVPLQQANEMKRVFTTLLMMSKPEWKENKSDAEDIADWLADSAQEDYDKDDSDKMYQNDTISNINTNLLSLNMLTLFGGILPEQTGQEVKPVTAVVAGNLFGIPSYGEDSPDVGSFMSQLKENNWLDASLEGFTPDVYMARTPFPTAPAAPTA